MGSDMWAEGDPYESYVGRWSRLVALRFLEWLDPDPGGSWLDVGCGTGALSESILVRADPVSVRGIDPSAGFIAHAKKAITDPRFSAEVGDAMALPVSGGGLDTVVSGLVLNFVPDPQRAVAEMRRAAGPGSVVAAYVWDYADRMQLIKFFWDAAAELDPAAADLDEGRRFAMCAPGPLADLFVAAGLDDVETRAIDVPTDFRDFDDYWTPFLGGQGPAPGYCVSLDDDRRAELRERLRSRLPIDVDGSVHLIARAWAVRGLSR